MEVAAAVATAAEAAAVAFAVVVAVVLVPFSVICVEEAVEIACFAK